jgi:hypothetical protein
LNNSISMNLDEVSRICDRLHECIDEGPGENPAMFASALTAVRKLKAGASWEYPLSILAHVETQLARWFSPDHSRGEDRGHFCREDLLNHISKLEDAWDRPRA